MKLGFVFRNAQACMATGFDEVVCGKSHCLTLKKTKNPDPSKLHLIILALYKCSFEVQLGNKKKS
jgi:hypothetical protein